eukprot:1138760-Pelagomonas_calceolata.AAC.3
MEQAAWAIDYGHGQSALGDIFKGVCLSANSLGRTWTRLGVCLLCRSLAGLKWLWAYICLSWLLCAVMNVPHHVPYTDWLMVYALQPHAPASAGIVVPECFSSPESHWQCPANMHAYQPPVYGCLHASQIWATSHLQQGIEMDNSIQKSLLRFMRSMLGVRTSTPSWNDLAEGVRGAATGADGMHVTHMLYADDLTLNANDPSTLQTMLNCLDVYAWKKHLMMISNHQNSQKWYTSTPRDPICLCSRLVECHWLIRSPSNI